MDIVYIFLLPTQILNMNENVMEPPRPVSICIYYVYTSVYSFKLNKNIYMHNIIILEIEIQLIYNNIKLIFVSISASKTISHYSK